MSGPNAKSSPSPTNEPRSASPTPSDNASTRIKAHLDAGASAAELAKEAYHICRINTSLRKDLRYAHNELRQAQKAKKKQAVQEDALSEMREELAETRKLLGRTWGLLEGRRAHVPEELRMAYHALRKRDKHDWQARKGAKIDGRLGREKGKRRRGGSARRRMYYFLLGGRDFANECRSDSGSPFATKKIRLEEDLEEDLEEGEIEE